MSKRNKKKNHNTIRSNASINSLSKPAIALTGLFFSVTIESEKHYLQFVEQTSKKIGLIREALLQTQIIPKFFDVLASDDLHDLKTLIAPITMELDSRFGMQPTREPYDDTRDDQMQMSYAEFISLKIDNSDFPQRLANLKNNNALPHVLSNYNGPVLSDGHFFLDFNSEDKTKLCDFDYQFPQDCVFAVDFNILGNKNPIDNFKNKCSDIELNESFQDFLQTTLNNTSISVLGFDLFSDASIFGLTLEENAFKQQLNDVLKIKNNTVLTLNGIPLFISFNDNKEIRLRLPFLTFDMYAQNVLLPEEHELVELLYASHEIKRHNISSILDDLGLDYDYVVGQRIDFVHEPEIQNNVIAKVMARDIIEGNIYYEESSHHAQGEEEHATSVNLALAFIDEMVMVVIMTMQDDNGIVKQINSYFLNPDLIDNPLDDVSDYFLSLGSKDIKHVALNEPIDITYCEHHMKLNGIVI
jgi:hypothetical protein